MKSFSLFLIALFWSAIAWGQSANARTPETIVQAHLLSGETSDAKLKAAIAALGGKGGIVDARGLPGAQTITSTVEIPANTTVLLHPNVVYTCVVKNAPCWSLVGDGSRLVGNHAGANDADPAAQTGTVFRMGPGVTSATDMIVVNPRAVNNLAGIEVGGITIDFNSRGSSVGRYGLATYAVNRSWIHDITILNPGLDGFHAETAPHLHSYDVTMDRIFVRSAARDGYRWDASQKSANLDFDRWNLNTLYYVGFNIGTQTVGGVSCPESGGRFGANGFNLTAGLPGQSVDDFEFTNLFVAAIGCGGTGVLLNAPIPGGYIIRIHISGEIEDDVGANGGLAVKAVSAAVDSCTGNDCPRTVQQVILDCYCGSGNWKGGSASPFNPTNISSMTVNGYSYRFNGISLVRTDGLSVVPGALPSQATYNPTGGWATFQGAGSDFLWYTDASNVLHIARTDPGVPRPTDYFLLDQLGKAFKPAENSSGSLGTPSNRWESVNTSKLQLGNSYTFGSLPPAPNGTIVYCSNCNATCTAGGGVGRTCFRENGIWTH